MYLYCPETRMFLWIADWRGWDNPYGLQLFSGEEGYMTTLSRFLSVHRGKPLIFTPDLPEVEEGAADPSIEFDEKHWLTHVEAAELTYRATADKYGVPADAVLHAPWGPEDGSC